MTALEAMHHAHHLWHTQGIGMAVAHRPVLWDERKHFAGWGEVEYVVGICKDEDAMEVFGRSTEGFVEAFRAAGA